MSGNIFFVGLNYEYVGNIAQELSVKTDKFFLDVNKLLEYSLIDIERVKNICGLEYLKKEQKNILFGIKDYENTFINVPYDFIIDEELFHLFNNSLIVFVDVNKKDLIKMNMAKSAVNNLNIELIAFEELSELLKQKASITVKSEGKLTYDIKLIEEKLKELKMWG